ncbi:methyltransferase family protein [Dongia mobilis]|uniref:Methyltransferase family protein n=2 Tax=Dongia mobilis TaxID=578943 RepID=A0A4R6WWY9_9PROT|nr:methyltransferase family protein [Dongia mobilis]
MTLQSGAMIHAFLSRPGRRRLILGLRTLFGRRPMGFFIPYRYAANVAVPGPYAAADDLCRAALPAMREALADLGRHRDALLSIGSDAAPPAPRWRQDWFAPLDAAMLHGFIHRHRPRVLIEVGSGHSTRFAARAIADCGLTTRHVAIDPAPRADIAALPVELHRKLLADTDPALTDGLGSGDILFIDSSHILMPGSDVDQLFNRVLPRLAPGVIVHVHDIFLPEDYPPAWHWRGYNEQSALLPLLTGGGFRLLFGSHFAARNLAAEIAATPLGALPPDISAAPATSFWMQRAGRD